MSEDTTERASIENDFKTTPTEVLESIFKNEPWANKLENREEEAREFLDGAIGLLSALQESAKNPDSQLPSTPDEANKLKAIWAVSAPGTYFQAFKNDRYQTKPWAAWMDRNRINLAFQIGRKIAELKLGHPISSNWVETERELNETAPLVIYNGTPTENAAVLEAKNTPWLKIPGKNIYPSSKIMVINPLAGIDNTIDQIQSFRLPPNFDIAPGDEIGVVLHVPQAMRFLYILENYQQIIPQGVNLRIFTLPSPPGSTPEYPMQELRGLTYYRFIANPPIAAASPRPAKI